MIYKLIFNCYGCVMMIVTLCMRRQTYTFCGTLEQSATKCRHREIPVPVPVPVLHDAVHRGDHAGKKLASTRMVERGRCLADCVNEVERRPVKDSIRADDDGEEVACGSINLRASGDARVRHQLLVGRQVELVSSRGLQRSEHVAHRKGMKGGEGFSNRECKRRLPAEACSRRH
jgi:hypothetical protein